MTAIAQALSAALIHFVWQGSIAGFLLWAVLLVMRNRSANARYVASCAALAVLAILPVITSAILYIRALPAGSGTHAAASLSQAFTAALPGSSLHQTAWLARLQFWTLPVWSLGVLLFSVRFVLGCKHAFVLGRQGEAADETIVSIITALAKRMGVERPVRMLISSIVDGPSVVGWLRPVILLPAATVLGLTPQQLEAVLAHELAHIRRHDYLVNMLQMLAETLFFYHPAVWWVSKRIRTERELCCDDLAVRSCGDALCYARALTTLEKLRVTPRMAPAPTAMGSTSGPLLYRIQRLMGVTTRAYGPRFPGLLAIGVGVACLALNVNWVRVQAQNPSAHQETAEESTALDFPGVHVDLGSSSVIHRTPVEYPEVMMKQGVRGTVNVEVTLDGTGNVSDARVLSGPEELRKPVLQSVLNWHFTRDAAGSTRQVSVGFDEPPAAGSEPRYGYSIFAETAPSEAAFENKIFQFKAMTVNSPDGIITAHVLIPGENPNSSESGEANAERDRAKIDYLQSESIRIARQEKMQIDSDTPPSSDRARDLEKTIEFLRHTRDEALTRGETQKVANLDRQMDTAKAAANAREASSAQGIMQKEAIAIPGRTIKAINTDGLSDPIRNDLLSRLPVRVGDVLSKDSIFAVSQTLHEFDEHLKLRLVPTDDGRAEIQIVTPESGPGWKILVK